MRPGAAEAAVPDSLPAVPPSAAAFRQRVACRLWPPPRHRRLQGKGEGRPEQTEPTVSRSRGESLAPHRLAIEPLPRLHRPPPRSRRLRLLPLRRLHPQREAVLVVYQHQHHHRPPLARITRSSDLRLFSPHPFSAEGREESSCFLSLFFGGGGVDRMEGGWGKGKRWGLCVSAAS